MQPDSFQVTTDILSGMLINHATYYICATWFYVDRRCHSTVHMETWCGATLDSHDLLGVSSISQRMQPVSLIVLCYQSVWLQVH